MLKKINHKELYRYVFYVFLFLIPFQSRKVFLTKYSFYTGSFTEFGSIFLYLSDVLLVLSIISYLVWHKSSVQAFFTEFKAKNANRSVKILRLMAILSVWFFISAFFHKDYWALGIFRSAKMLEMTVLCIFAYRIFKNKRIFITSLFVLILSASFQGIIAIFQFLNQKSLFNSPFLHKITGETILSPDLPGIAKISLEGEKLIRAYGTFPHPNLLGGFLIFSFFISLFLYIKHKYDYLSSECLLTRKIPYKIQEKLIFLFWLIIFIVQFMGIFLSFSRSAWMAFAISAVFYALFYIKYLSIVSRETFKTFSSGKIISKHKELALSLLFISLFVIANVNLISDRTMQDISPAQGAQEASLPQNNAFNDRLFFDNVSRETISENPVLGSGPGTSIFQINSYLHNSDAKGNLADWQYQPAHNIYLLSASELGIVGFLLFLYIIIETLLSAKRKIVSRETISEEKTLKISLMSILLAFLFIGIFDHYFWTLQQGIIIFWLTIGMVLV